MPPGQGEFELAQTTVRVEGSDNDIIFTNLVISQQLADTNSFSFIWRKEQQDANFSTHVDFYRANLAKEVTIVIHDDFTFKGIINSISFLNQDEMASEYQILGKGLFAKLDEVEECNSFYKKTLTQIFEALNTTQGTQLNLSPTNTNELFYHVQYNSTTFNFYRMLAIRYGEWLFYDGAELVLKAPTNAPVELRNGTDVLNLHINASIRKATVPGVGYDHYSGEVLRNTPSESNGSGMIAASTEAGNNAFGSEHTGRRIETAPTNDLLREMNTLMQRATAASAVYVEGDTRNPQVKLGGKIKIMDRQGNSEGEYIITQVHHSASSSSHYQNHFTAVPADVQVPPYTNPMIYPVCHSQPATVVKNEDADGLDRIKVRFPWMQDSESTPWISVMVPYAGSNRGMRFTPEVDEEVLIDFADNNAERPFMIGSFYTHANTSGIAHSGNNVKAIVSRTGRRFEIDDEDGVVRIFDNYPDKNPKNGLLLNRKDGEQKLTLKSEVDTDNYSFVGFDKNDHLSLGIKSGGEVKAIIWMYKDGPRIKIRCEGSIQIEADKDIAMNANGKITIQASDKIEMIGNGGIEMNGRTVLVNSDSSLDLKGVNTLIEGSAKLQAKGGAMASLQGAIVKIN